MRTTISIALFVLFAQFVCLSASMGESKVGSTSQISINTAGGAPAAPSGDPAIGANGRHLVFTSRAGDLVAGDTNAYNDIFVKDLESGTLTRVSVTSAGADADAGSDFAAVSPVLLDGFYAIAMQSGARNVGSLVNPPGASNIFIRLPTLNVTEIVSPDPDSSAAGGVGSTQPSITALRRNDGTNEVRVVFASDSGTLVNGDSNTQQDIFLARFKVPKGQSYNLSDQLSLDRISLAVDPSEQSNGRSEFPKISADGRYVVFVSYATNLTSGLPAGTSAAQIYRFDTVTKTTQHISKSSSGESASSDCSEPSISFNGQTVVYKTFSTNIVQSDQSESAVVVWHDTVSGVNRRVNENAAAEQGDGQASYPMVSSSGRLVTFSDSSTNLVNGDTNNLSDVFVKDMDSGKVVRMSVGPGGSEANAFSVTPVIAAPYSSLSLTVGFASYATNLTEPTTSTTLSDIYQNTLSLDPPVLTATTPLEVPPEVTVGAKKIKITAQKFSISPVTASSRKILYEFEVTTKTKGSGAQRTTRSTLLSKRNTVTSIKQKSTTYVVRNRVRVVSSSTGATEFKTGFTPRQSFKTAS